MKKIYAHFLKHPYLFLIICFAAYTICFFLIDQWDRGQPHIIHCALDDFIPFSRFAVFFYIAWFPFLALPLLYLLKKHAYQDAWNLAVPMLTAMFLSLIIYLFWYNGLSMRPAEVTENDLAGFLVRMIHSADTPTNVCPSIHVSTTLLIDMGLSESQTFKDHKRWKIFFHILSILICLSTLFLKQHSVIDAVCGALLALAVHAVFKRNGRQ